MRIDRMTLVSSALLSAANTALTALFYTRMPSSIPIHWNAAGVPNGFAPRAAIWPIALLPLLTYLLLLATEALDRRRGTFSSENRDKIAVGLILVFGVEFVFLLPFFSATGIATDFGLVIVIFSGLLMIALGNVLPRVRQNSFIGIKTVWTVSDETVWNSTHRIGGYSFTICGALLLLSLLAPASWRVAVIPAAVLLAVAVPIGYSFFRYIIDRS
jgi:uncharacterized membrane protein